PRADGAQTAVVVGPKAEEMFVDKYGRVKVQFHWDRLGRRDADRSCWLRVVQPWAGKGFGSMHLPRVGQEVVVNFLDADPDRPVVVGSVYNAENMPPFELPEQSHVTGIRSQTLRGDPGEFH